MRGNVLGIGARRARARAQTQARSRACSQRQFVDIKQRSQHPNTFTRRPIGYCAIKVLQLYFNNLIFVI